MLACRYAPQRRGQLLQQANELGAGFRLSTQPVHKRRAVHASVGLDVRDELPEVRVVLGVDSHQATTSVPGLRQSVTQKGQQRLHRHRPSH